MDWKGAEEWLAAANKGRDPVNEPVWSWDCGLKLDFDGHGLHVSSRFYQDSTDIFSGSVSFCIGDDDVFRTEFSPRHIDKLRSDVEAYVAAVLANLKALLSARENLWVFLGSRGI